MKNLKWNQILGSILLGAGLGLAGFSFLLVNNLFSSRIKAYVVTSGSMEPAIKTGSVVFTRSLPSYKQGDIISFYPDNNKEDVVTHRIAAKTYENNSLTPTYKTSGDANEEIDNWNISSSQVIGKVSINIPYLGFIVEFAKSPKGFVALVIIPAAIIIYEELKTLGKEIRKYFMSIFLKYKKNTNKNTSSQKKLILLFPLFISFLVFASVSGAYFSDKELSNDNTLGVSTTYSPSPSPTLSPTSTPLESVTLEIENTILIEPQESPVGTENKIEIP